VIGKNQEQPEIGGHGETEHRQSANQVTKRKEFFRGEISVCELVAEEQADYLCDRECVKNPRLLGRRKSQCRQVAKYQRKPSSPNEYLSQHHREQLAARCAGRRIVQNISAHSHSTPV